MFDAVIIPDTAHILCLFTNYNYTIYAYYCKYTLATSHYVRTTPDDDEGENCVVIMMAPVHILFYYYH